MDAAAAENPERRVANTWSIAGMYARDHETEGRCPMPVQVRARCAAAPRLRVSTIVLCACLATPLVRCDVVATYSDSGRSALRQGVAVQHFVVLIGVSTVRAGGAAEWPVRHGSNAAAVGSLDASSHLAYSIGPKIGSVRPTRNP